MAPWEGFGISFQSSSRLPVTAFTTGHNSTRFSEGMSRRPWTSGVPSWLPWWPTLECGGKPKRHAAFGRDCRLGRTRADPHPPSKRRCRRSFPRKRACSPHAAGSLCHRTPRFGVRSCVAGLCPNTSPRRGCGRKRLAFSARLSYDFYSQTARTSAPGRCGTAVPAVGLAGILPVIWDNAGGTPAGPTGRMPVPQFPPPRAHSCRWTV